VGSCPLWANPPHFARSALLHPCPRIWSFYFAFSLFFLQKRVLYCCHRATMLWPPFLGLAVSSAFVAPCSRLLSSVFCLLFSPLVSLNPQSFEGRAFLGSRLRQLSLYRPSFCLSDPPLASHSLTLSLHPSSFVLRASSWVIYFLLPHNIVPISTNTTFYHKIIIISDANANAPAQSKDLALAVLFSAQWDR